MREPYLIFIFFKVENFYYKIELVNNARFSHNLALFTNLA